MQLVQALVRNGQLHVGQVAIEQIHVVPRNDVLVDMAMESFGNDNDRALKPRGEAAKNATHSNLGAQKTQLRARHRQLKVVHSHDLKALRVNDLPVQKVAGKKNLVRLQIAEANILRRDLQRDAVFREFIDVLAPRDHERDFSRALKGHARDARKNLARGNSKVGHGAQFFTSGIDHRLVHHLREIKHYIPYVSHLRLPQRGAEVLHTVRFRFSNLQVRSFPSTNKSALPRNKGGRKRGHNCSSVLAADH